MIRSFASIRRAGAVLVLASAWLGGCSSPLPCLEYTTRQYPRIIGLHGMGLVQVNEKKMVCSLRAEPAGGLQTVMP